MIFLGQLPAGDSHVELPHAWSLPYVQVGEKVDEQEPHQNAWNHDPEQPNPC
jgi:hypothetical protein